MKKLKLNKGLFSENPDGNSLFDKVISREETKKILGGLAFSASTVNTTRGTVSHACDPCGLDTTDENNKDTCVGC